MRATLCQGSIEWWAHDRSKILKSTCGSLVMQKIRADAGKGDSEYDPSGNLNCIGKTNIKVLADPNSASNLIVFKLSCSFR